MHRTLLAAACMLAIRAVNANVVQSRTLPAAAAASAAVVLSRRTSHECNTIAIRDEHAVQLWHALQQLLKVTLHRILQHTTDARRRMPTTSESHTAGNQSAAAGKLRRAPARQCD
jgi:hypothetical protein